MKPRARRSLEYIPSDKIKTHKKELSSYNITLNNSSYFSGSLNLSGNPDLLRTPKNPNLKSCPSGYKIKIKPKFLRQDKQRMLSHKVLTAIETKEVQDIIEGKVKVQMVKLKKRLDKKIQHMNKIGIVPTKANQVRGMSLLSVESSFMYGDI